MPDVSTPAADWVRRGQSREAEGTSASLAEAVRCYDQAIALLRAPSADVSSDTPRALAVAWMNRGNALQKIAAATPALPAEKQPSLNNTLSVSPIMAAVAAYDEAISLLGALPLATTPVYRNHLGAAWLNRGHALLATHDPASAVVSFERAIDVLRPLPLGENSAYRLNLAGAWANLAHALHSAPLHAFPRACAAAQTALDLVANFGRNDPAFAEMDLRARRALVTAVGELLVLAEAAHQSTAALASAASDAIDDGLALARDWERRGATHLRPLAARLFRLGAQLYRVHQPHFLAEFLLENIGPAQAADAFAADPEFRAAAHEAIAACLADLHRPRLLVAGAPDSEKLLAIVRALRDAERRLAGYSRGPAST